jgi:hypothetical protein
MLSRDEFVAKEYNSFMVIKALSMDASLAPYLHPFNTPTMRNADPYIHYITLFKMIPKKYRKTVFLKGKQTKYDEIMITAVATYYQVSPKKAEGYLDTMSEIQRKEVLDLCIRAGIIEDDKNAY